MCILKKEGYINIITRTAQKLDFIYDLLHFGIEKADCLDKIHFNYFCLDGISQKISNIIKINFLGWDSKISLEECLKKVILERYVKNESKIEI